jgi:hypothetical protein
MKYNSSSDFSPFIQQSELAAYTKKSYLTRLRGLEHYLNKPIFDVVRDAAPSIKAVQKIFLKPTSLKSYLLIPAALFRHVPHLKEQLPAAHKLWSEAYKQTNDDVETNYKQNKPSERQLEGYVPYADIVSKRDTLPKGSAERLLLAMYTHIYPMRADYNAVRLYTRQLPAQPEPNYILLGARGCKLVLHEYKTARTHGVYEKELPAALCEEVHASLEAAPRDYLFVNSYNKPYTDANGYVAFASRVFKRVFGKPLTINIVRHAFISSLDYNTLSVADKERIAKEMGHTAAIQDQYRLIFDK